MAYCNKSSSRKPATKLNDRSAIGQEGKTTPNVDRSSKRNACGGEKMKTARSIPRSQIPKLPSRLRNAGYFLVARGRQNSQKATTSKLPTNTTRVRGASWRLLMLATYGNGPDPEPPRPRSEWTHARRKWVKRCREERLTDRRDGIVRRDTRI